MTDFFYYFFLMDVDTPAAGYCDECGGLVVNAHFINSTGEAIDEIEDEGDMYPQFCMNCGDGLDMFLPYYWYVREEELPEVLKEVQQLYYSNLKAENG